MPVYWNYGVERRFTDTAPLQAHRLAAAGSAGEAAGGIRSQYTGTLAREVSTPRTIATMTSEIGSGAGGRAPLPYGRIEHFGGTIRGRPLLYIRDRRPGRGSRGRTRSTYGGPIVAVVAQVQHRGKHYLDLALHAYPPLFIELCRRFMPG